MTPLHPSRLPLRFSGLSSHMKPIFRRRFSSLQSIFSSRIPQSLVTSRRQATSVTGSLLCGSMLASFILPALAVCTFVTSAVAQGACNATQYTSLACLTGDRGAASVCSMAPRHTITLTVTTTTLDINTQTLTAHATSQTTVNVTKTELSTTTITT